MMEQGAGRDVWGGGNGKGNRKAFRPLNYMCEGKELVGQLVSMIPSHSYKEKNWEWRVSISTGSQSPKFCRRWRAMNEIEGRKI